uniref:Uncharacterized protein n=1 Tax=Romanomermis culicivorax TaxID=13658 RepID=A0A915KSU6_ROMCU
MSAGFETNSLKRFNIVVEKLNNSENRSSIVLIDQYVDLRILFDDERTDYRLCNSSLLMQEEDEKEEEGLDCECNLFCIRLKGRTNFHESYSRADLENFGCPANSQTCAKTTCQLATRFATPKNLDQDAIWFAISKLEN